MGDQKICQLKSIPKVSLSAAEDYHRPVAKSIKLILFKWLSPHFKHQLKLLLFDPKQFLEKTIQRPRKRTGASPVIDSEHILLKSGDKVRVRSREEILSTLDHWGQLKGCAFLEEMCQYCGSIQEVLKPIQRFVDERDQNVKRTRGIVILKDVLCQGTSTFGVCDRSCFYFWREEWLEKL